eukprot:GEMP01014528.1.p1 GENE.GEMP01014528.1~~GEMP01014528.1.p1  ORF type:complete len:490 (-),score=93.31 GEMP01014528.1:1422-2891(-)
MPFCCVGPDIIPDVAALPGPVDELRTKLKGDLLLFGDEGYDELRLSGKPIAGRSKQTKTWNLDAAKYPSAFAQVADAEDVSVVVSYAREHCIPNGTLLSVACGRHSHLCLVQDTLCVDLSRLRNVRLDKEEKVVYVEGGCCNADVDDVTLPHNLAVTLGHAGSTGIGGLVPQGGHGFLERSNGLTVDSLLEVTIVVTSGEILKASRTENQELFWGVCGAGHNFGIITEFKMQLSPMPETLFGGERVHLALGFAMWPSRKDLIMNFAKATGGCNKDEATGLIVLPASAPIVIDAYAWFGENKDDGREHFKDALKFGSPLVNNVSDNCKYSHLQSLAQDKAVKTYMSGIIVPEMTEQLAEVIEKQIKTAPTGECVCIIIPTGGKGGIRGEDFPVIRHGLFWILFGGTWSNNQDRPKCCAWVQKFRKEVAVATATSMYGTLAGNVEESEKEDIHAFTDDGKLYFGDYFPRLQALKRRYDPTNVFRLNINIQP